MTPNVAAAKAALCPSRPRPERGGDQIEKPRLLLVFAGAQAAHGPPRRRFRGVPRKSEAEVIEVLKVCYAHDVPVTTRGAGTGNYGQAMPLAGGCVMHLRHMNKVKEIHPGRVIASPAA
jgi:FAD/FMN-containing dehydrogenase